MEQASEWHPEPQDVERILVEMRPIIRQFARRARAACAAAAAAAARGETLHEAV